MEATNISINKQSIVSINVETLQAIKQHLWFMVKGAWLRVIGSMSLPLLYRRQLRMARAVAAWCDRHNTLVNWLMAIQVMTFAFYVFMFV